MITSNRLDTARLARALAAAILLAGSLMTAACSSTDVRFPPLAPPAGVQDAVQLHAVLLKPDGPGPFSAVVLMHGCGGMYSNGGISTREQSWAKLLRDRGYVALIVDSFGPRGVSSICSVMSSAPVRADRDRPRDAYGALAWLQTQPFVKPDRIAVMGWSHGGATALFTVDAAPPVRPDSAAPDFRAAVSFYPSCGPAMRSRWTTRVPTLLMLGAKDEWGTPAACREMAEARSATGVPVSYMWYPEAYHDFDWPGMALQPHLGVASHPVLTGMNPEARADALQRVPAFLDHWLKE